MKISGSIGYTILHNYKLNKKILLFADIHDGVNYCQDVYNSINIDDYLISYIKDKKKTIILEESINDPSLDLIDLWPNAQHTQDLKIMLNQYPSKIIPTDIRPLLIPFSWQFLNKYKKYENMKLHQYLYFMSLFFTKKGIVWNKYIFTMLEFIDKDHLETILIQFKEIRQEFVSTFIKYLNLKLIEFDSLKNKDGLKYFEEVDRINSLIMEWYIIIIIFSDKKTSIIHTGLAHSSNLIHFLVNLYDFEIEKQSGVNYIEEITDWNNLPTACVLLPNKDNYMI